MANINKTLLKTIIKISILGLLLAFSFSIVFHYIITPILIPDECYYHSQETSILIDLLYDFPAIEGFHPVPSLMGYFVFSTIGFCTWIFIIRTRNKKNKTVHSKDTSKVQ